MERYVQGHGGVLYARLMAATFLAVFMLLGMPLLVSAAEPSVVISEVMWDGVEYVELYNLGDDDVPIGGWSLTRQQATGDQKVITIFDEEIVLQQGEYFLIERNESATGLEAGLVVSGLTLVNGGELVSLLDGDGELIDEVNWLGDWFAGENTSVGVAMERTSLVDGGDDEDNWHSSTGEVGGRLGTPGEINSEPLTNVAPDAVVDGEEEVLVGELVLFTGQDSSDPEGLALNYSWSFGDGETGDGMEVEHIFSSAGLYTVTLSVDDGDLEDEDSYEVVVVKPNYSDDVVINEFLVNPEGSDSEGEFIELRNTGDYEVDLAGWELDDQDGGSSSYIIGEVVLDGGEIKVFNRSDTGIALNNSGDEVRLIDPLGEVRDSFSYSETVPEGQSYNYDDDNYLLSTTITAGGENEITQDDEETDDGDEDDVGVGGKVAGESIVDIELKDLRDYEVGTMVKTSGVVSAPPGVFGDKVLYLAGSGSQVYFSKADYPDLKLGDEVSLTGEVSSIRGETRIKLAQVTDISKVANVDPPDPHVIETGDVDESNEGFLVTIQGHVTSTSGDVFYVDDGSGEAKVYIKESTEIHKPKMKKGMAVTITGVVSETSSGYRVLPRFQEDVRIGLVAGLTSFPATGSDSDLLVVGLLALAGYLVWSGRNEPLFGG